MLLKIYDPELRNFGDKLVFILGKPFRNSLMFASKIGAYPSEAPIRCVVGSWPYPQTLE
jgi:hypothetical protein